jgi:O-antigen/teichoic acid export membrane protein
LLLFPVEHVGENCGEGTDSGDLVQRRPAQPLNQKHTPAESVSSRYIVTLGAQVFRLLLSLATAAIVPRALGPTIYGNYTFLLSTSAAMRGVLDTGTQQAFFTFSAQERASGPLTRLYALVLGAQIAIVAAIIGVAAATGRTEWLWHAQHLDQIVLVTALDWLLFLAISFQQLGDSKGLTAYLQLSGAAIAALALVGLVALRVCGALDFYTFVYLNLACAGLTCGVQGYRLLVKNRALLWSGAVNVAAYAQRWWRFTRPLIFLQFYLQVVAYLGLYLIQTWYGSEEQGYYALALQWSAFAMVFTNSGVWIFWREIAHHSGGNDLRHAARAYEQFSALFLYLALALACWLSTSSAVLVQLVAGVRFHAAGNVLAVMSLYPVSQTMSQLATASLKATEHTASYARWTVLLSIPELLLTYLLLAPTSAPVPGLHLGAIGMAIKTALYGLVVAQVYDWLNCRFLGIQYARALGRRALALLAVGAAAAILIGAGDPWLRRAGMEQIEALIVCSVGYAAVIALMIWLWPGLAGLSRAQIVRGIRSLHRA